MGKNYVIEKRNWCPLSDIMNQDYETTHNYRLYVNQTGLGNLKYLHTEETPTAEMYGRDLPDYTTVDIQADTGDHIYLCTTANPVNVYIENV